MTCKVTQLGNEMNNKRKLVLWHFEVVPLQHSHIMYLMFVPSHFYKLLLFDGMQLHGTNYVSDVLHL